MESHLLQMRGLKQNQLYKHYHPHQSHLLQMRGLKPVEIAEMNQRRGSHLLQMRGLKHPYQKRYQHNSQVASFTDAWIETTNINTIKIQSLVASFTDAWIETSC